MTGGEAIVATLKLVGIDTIFGIPGVHTGGFYDAIYAEPSIRHVMTRHEQGAAFMADGYARASGRIACLSTITGPGVTNAATGLGEARADSSPILHIASTLDPQTHGHDVGELHELHDQSGVLRSIVGHHQLVRTIQEIPEAVIRAMQHMRSTRPGPASIEIPLALLTDHAPVDLPSAPLMPDLAPEPETIAQAAQMLAQASSPVIYVGGGAMDAGAALVAIAERLQAPVLTTHTGKGAFPESHPLSLGCKMRQDATAYEFLQSCDVALVVGCRLGHRTTDGGTLPLPSQIIQIDIDASSIGHARKTAIGIQADASEALAALLEEDLGEPKAVDPDNVQRVRLNQDYIASNPDSAQMLEALRAVMPADAVLVNDMTMVSYDAPKYFTLDHPRSFMFPNYFGTLGFSLPAAIGAQVACPGRTIVSISGDGGFLFTSEELATAVREQLPVIVIVSNDGLYAAIDRHQRRTFNDRTLDMRLTNPDFVKLAESYGMPGVAVSDPDSLARETRAAADRDGPSLIVYELSDLHQDLHRHLRPH